jgi:crotonobetainyl-CoA:carnitine CoA-transferase CaiB-like acyl-CoA transferase
MIEPTEIPVAPVLQYSQMSQIKPLKERRMVRHKPTKLIGSPIRINNQTIDIRTGPPKLGAHTEEVLTAVLKLGKEKIKNLRQNKTIN